MFFKIVFVPIAVVVLVVFFFGLVYYRIVVIPRCKKREADQLALEAFLAEAKRIEALPKLSTQWLMRMPTMLMNNNPTLRSYGTRYNRMFIVDEVGNGWNGLVIPEILEGLIAGEYVWQDYYIPFRGAGESYAGKPVDVTTSEGMEKIHIYPTWMTEGVNIPDWNLWARIERNFRDCSRSWNYQSGLSELNEHIKEFREKRTKLATLAKMNEK